MNATRRDLEIQFKRVVDNGWLPWVQREAKRAGTTTAHKLAIESRETNIKNIRGDYRGGQYHGYGIEQVDIGTDPNYCRNWRPDNVEGGIMGGTKIYLTKVRDTEACVGRKSMCRNRSFVGKAVEADDLRRIATAAYNCGRWAHYHFSRGENLDSTTTGHDYSRDVYDRAIEFADILEKAGYEQNAVALELDAQGKYARAEHQRRFGHMVIEDRVKLPAGEPQEAQDELAAVDYERDEQAPAAVVDSAGSASLADGEEPALNSAAEPGAGAAPGLGEDAASAPPAVEVKKSETVETDQGSKTLETTLSTPAGDPPDAPPSSFLHLEDWKPFAARWLKRTWTAVSGVTLPGGFGLGFMALKDPPNWFIYVAIGVVLIVIVLGLGLIVSGVLLLIWYFNRKEIAAGKMEAARSLVDPDRKNLGVKIEPK